MIDFARKDKKLPVCPKCGADVALVIRNRRYHCVRCGKDLGSAYLYHPLPRRGAIWAC